jgi:hypothetical protein
MIGVGGVQPAACRRVMSALATVATTAPSSARRYTVTGGAVGVE